MKILVIADTESPVLWDYYEKEKLEGIDLILSAGDLCPEYLSFLVTMTNVPLLYVHGNHDTCYDKNPPEGCVCIDDHVYVHKGIRIMGLGGSMNYNFGKYQFTEKEMMGRLRRLAFPLLRHRRIDILLTHAPARGIHDMNTMAHRGFQTFIRILEHYHPRYFIHGHIHRNYGAAFRRLDAYKETTVINAYGYYIFEYK